jgi:hypothetical protein
MNDERYECATCCYATNSYAKFLAHGKEHSLENPADKKEDLKEVQIREDAARWKKLIRLCGSVQDASDVTVKLFWDDATLSAHIQVGNKTYGTDQRSFESVIDSIDWPDW